MTDKNDQQIRSAELADDRIGARDAAKREYVRPELTVVPLREAMTGATNLADNDGAGPYS